MAAMPASIFNDVIGPVMRGPSSSHTAASARIAEIARMSLGGTPARAVVDFDVNGSLAATHEGQGADMGLVCGFAGVPLTDEGAENYRAISKKSGMDVEFRVYDFGAKHPNTYRIELTSRGGVTRRWEALSTGGGMIEMTRFEDFPVSIRGDFYEVLAIFDKRRAEAGLGCGADFARVEERGGMSLLSLKFGAEPDRDALSALLRDSGAAEVIFVDPVLPTLSRAGCSVPFSTAEAALAWNDGKNLAMWELAAEYEASRGGVTRAEVFDRMSSLVEIMERSLDFGLSGTDYKDRILGPQARLIEPAAASGALLPCGLLNAVIKSVTAVMEAKSAMGVIVAAPTAGSCGCLPGTVIGAARALGKSRDDVTRAMLAAGLVGVFIAEGATFAAEVGGCQVECGAGSGMAAAALVQLMDGSARQCADAASMSLQNITGLACDPVASRVEVPCLGKNVMGGANALSCANMALAGYDKVIPLDETIAAMYDVGTKLPSELRCTFGGLGKAPTARKIAERLENAAR